MTLYRLVCGLSICLFAHMEAQVIPIGGGSSGIAKISPSFIGSCSAAGVSHVGSCSFSTTGSTLYYVGLSYPQGGTLCTLTSSPSSTFIQGSSYQPSFNVVATSYYAFGPSTSGSNSFTVTCNAGEPTFTAIAFAGTFGGSVEGATGANSGGSSVTSQAPGSTGSLTGVPYEACATHVGLSNGQSGMAFSVGSGFASPFSAGATTGFLPSGDSYLIPSVSTALNPSWSWSGVSGGAAAAALVECFK